MKGCGRVWELGSVGEAGRRDTAGNLVALSEVFLLSLSLLEVVDGIGVVHKVWRKLHLHNWLSDIDVHCLALCWLDHSPTQLLGQLQAASGKLCGHTHRSTPLPPAFLRLAKGDEARQGRL